MWILSPGYFISPANYISTDLINWTPITTPEYYSGSPTSIQKCCYANGYYYLFIRGIFGAGIARTKDFSTFETLWSSSAYNCITGHVEDGFLVASVFAMPIMGAATYNNVLLYSADGGKTIVNKTLPASSSWGGTDILCSDGVLSTISSGSRSVGCCAYSLDKGQSWIAGSIPSFSGSMHGLSACKDGVFIFPTNITYSVNYLRSVGGKAYSAVSGQFSSVHVSFFADKDLFYAVHDKFIYTSADGASWTLYKQFTTETVNSSYSSTIVVANF